MEGKLPKGWEQIPLGDILSLEYGKSLASDERSGNGFPVYGSNGIVGYHETFLVKGPGIIVGRKGSYGEIAWCDSNFFPIDTTYYVLASQALNIRFAYYCLKSVDLKSLNRSTAIPGLNRTDAYNLSTPLPPLNEQKRIAARLDEIFAHLDVLKAKLEQVPVLLKQFRQQVLQQAVTGKLTEDWRKNYHFSSSSLLENLIKQRSKIKSQTGNKRLYTVIDQPHITPYELPKEWSWTTFRTCCEKVFDGTHFSPKNYSTGDYMYITAKNIKEKGIQLSNITYVSKEVHKEIYSRADVKRNDVLYIKDGATTGIATVNTLDEEFSLLSSVGVFRLNSKYILPQFVSYYLNSPITRERMLSNVAGIAITRLTLVKLNDELLALPSTEEQTEIVRRVDALFAHADALEEQYHQLKKQIGALPQSILAKAFRGELVPQDPKDEPASELLKRIRQEKETKGNIRNRKVVKPSRKQPA